ncbi:MAG: hypothetical protein CMH49_05120 [Myxococcales bacterium]|nr:hypothetical protein [Myxococcales bacterium]
MLINMTKVILFFIILMGNCPSWAKKSEESPPFDFNPLLDQRPITPKRERSVEWTQGASGFRVSSYLGLSFGSAASYLSPRISSLDVGTFPLFGVSLAYRLGSGSTDHWAKRIELSLNGSLGFGRTFELGTYDDALDIHLRPMLTLHLLEGQSFGLATVAGLNAIMFDVEEGEVSQLALGSYLGARTRWIISDQAELYLEFAWSHLYDYLAYEFREPTEAEIEDNPSIVEIKEKGQWFNHYQILLGLQLLGF